MREPSFWWRERSVAATLLAPLGLAYGAVAAGRLRQAGRSAALPVVCVGNLTIGGAGKTPTAIAIAHLLLDAGQRPFFLSRGYGGRLAGPVRVDPRAHGALDVGDEPLLLARVAPTIVGRDRARGAEMAHAAGASVLVLDDGLQNPSLVKDFALVVVDARRGVGNGLVLPAGPLRVPADAQLERADAMLVLGPGARADGLAKAAVSRGLPVLYGTLDPDPNAVAALSGRKVLAFAGIGDPEKFFATLDAARIVAPIRRAFADHHRYTADDATALIDEARRHQLCLVTTEKDLLRLKGDAHVAALATQAKALPVSMVVEDQDTFRALVLQRLNQ